MVSYKLVNFEGFEEKAKRLGITIKTESRDTNFIVIRGEGEAWYTNNRDDYNRLDYQEITQADFLALPEPIKIGDWIRNGSEKRFGISQVFSVEGDKINKVEKENGSSYLDVKDCTKLTDKQIKILGLE